MPIIQNSGLLDGTWPPEESDGLHRLQSLRFWMDYNNIPVSEDLISPGVESGLKADNSYYTGADERFLYQQWFSRDEGALPLLTLVLAKRMPHALDLRQTEIFWNYMKQFRRNPDGSLSIHDERYRK